VLFVQGVFFGQGKFCAICTWYAIYREYAICTVFVMELSSNPIYLLLFTPGYIHGISQGSQHHAVG